MIELRIALPSVLESALALRVAESGYADPSDYVRELLHRELSEAVADRRWLKAMIDQGLASGLCEEDAFEVLDKVISEDPDLRG